MGDALHPVLCAAGFNIRWLLRAVARLGLGGLLLVVSAQALYAPVMVNPRCDSRDGATAEQPP